jgi:serine/threonine-protein kinase RsbT
VTVCQEGRALCARLGFSRTASTQVVTAISEVAGNIWLYAGRGEVVLSTADEPTRVGIAVLARDRGPGIEDVELAMQDGYSTAKGMGLGLPGARRLMDDFQISSEPGRGTTVRMRRWRPRAGFGGGTAEPLVEWEIARREGADASGRREIVAPFRNGVLLAAVAGAGSGDRAASSAEAAASSLEAHPEESPISLIERSHEALRATGGASIALASISSLDARMTWIGVGESEGLLVRASPASVASESAPVHPGLLGDRLPPLRASTVFVTRGDTLLLTSGPRPGGLPLELPPGRPVQEAAEAISSGREPPERVVVARFLRGVHERRPPAA